MTIAEIITRAELRGKDLFTPYSHCFVGFSDEGKRAILFGLYANGGTNGFTYLVEISTEQLAQIVSQYESSMAGLDADRQKLVLDIAAKHYLDTLEQQIHDQKMAVKQSDIDMSHLEFNAKDLALDSDRKALEGLREKAVQAQARANADIDILNARISEEAINMTQVEVDILEKAIAVKRANLRTLEAGIRGLDIQLDIRNTALQNIELLSEKHRVQQQIDLTPGELLEAQAEEINAHAAVLKTSTDNALLDADIAEIQNRLVRTQLDVVSRGVDTALLDVDIAKANFDIASVDTDIKEMAVKTARETARQIELQTDIAMMDVRVVELQLDVDRVAVQLADIQTDITMIDVRMLQDDLIRIDQRIAELRRDTTAYEIPTKKAAQIAAVEKQIAVLQTKLAATMDYQTLENDMYASRVNKQNSGQAYRLAMANLDKELSLHRAEMRIDSFSKDITIVNEQRTYQRREDLQHNKIPASQIEAAKDGRDAAIEAAKTMAMANIMNTLAHKILKQ